MSSELLRWLRFFYYVELWTKGGSEVKIFTKLSGGVNDGPTRGIYCAQANPETRFTTCSWTCVRQRMVAVLFVITFFVCVFVYESYTRGPEHVWQTFLLCVSAVILYSVHTNTNTQPYKSHDGVYSMHECPPYKLNTKRLRRPDEYEEFMHMHIYTICTYI